MLSEYQNSGFLHANLDFFPENLGAASEKQGKCLYQDIMEMKKR